MRISDWSSDVCSSDLALPRAARDARRSDRVAPPHPSLYAVDMGRDGVAAPQGLDHQNLIRPNIPLDETYITYIIPINRIRSEEHTSELQSLMRSSYAVFCLKKKTTIKKK